MRTLFRIIFAAFGFLPSIALAHEGHGHENPLSPGHYIANPGHAIPLVLIIAGVTVFVVRRHYAKKKG